MATPSLQDLTYFANRSYGGVGSEEVNSDRGRAALAAAQQYDPGATWRQEFGSDGQPIGYTLDFDASKFPGLGGGSLGGMSGHGSGADYQIPFSTVQPNMQLGDPNAVTNDANYGRVTQNTNIEQPSSLLDVLGPLGVAGFGLLMGGIPALYQGVFGQGPYGGVGDFMYSGTPGAVDSWDPSVMGDPSAYGMNPSVANTPLGSAESSLYGPDVGDNPAAALGGGTQPPAPIVDQGTAARVGDVIRNGGIPGLDNIASSLGGLTPSNILNALGKVPGLLGGNAGGSGGGGGGGGLLNLPPAQYNSLLGVVKRYYGGANG